MLIQLLCNELKISRQQSHPAIISPLSGCPVSLRSVIFQTSSAEVQTEDQAVYQREMKDLVEH
jgi:hypothetical protein